jgi:aminodeoxyfutalosine deaminase
VFHANVVVPGDGEPVVDGAVVADDDGTIADVGRAADVLVRHAGAPVVRVKGAVLPGLVNAHTHLELSGLRGRVPGGMGFVPWVDRLVAARAEVRPEEDVDTIEGAVEELDAAGTSGVGDVTNTLAAVGALARRDLAGVVFHELLGVRADALDRASAIRHRFGEWPSSDLAYRPSPHALYTTPPGAIQELASRAREGRARISLHFCEHAAERAAIERGHGAVAEWFSRLGIEREWPLRPLLDVAEELGALGPGVLLVHLTDARLAELDRVARSGAAVVLCPRSNLHIETRLPPLLAMRTVGIEPALGTDSLASNRSLDVFEEARALADRFPQVSARELVQMATWNGARALGRLELGRIAKGARPGLLAIEGEPGGDACAWLIRHVRAPRRWLTRRNGS